MTIEDIKKDIDLLKDKLDKLYISIVGSELSKDGGIFKRIEDVEKEVEVLVQKKYEQKIAWVAMGVAGLFMLRFVLAQVMDLIKK
jgi:hypothetical protein